MPHRCPSARRSLVRRQWPVFPHEHVGGLATKVKQRREGEEKESVPPFMAATGGFEEGSATSHARVARAAVTASLPCARGDVPLVSEPRWPAEAREIESMRFVVCLPSGPICQEYSGARGATDTRVPLVSDTLAWVCWVRLGCAEA
jgi:hypothetical protein